MIANAHLPGHRLGTLVQSTAAIALLTVLFLGLFAVPALAGATVELGASTATISEGGTFTRMGTISLTSGTIWDTLRVDYGDPPGDWQTLDRETSIPLSRAYHDDGVHRVVLRATGVDYTYVPELGQSLPLPWEASDQVDVTITNVPPAVVWSPDTHVTAGVAFPRIVAFTDPGADTWHLEVEWSDGNTDIVPNLTGLSHEFQHTYEQPGTYAVAVTVVDDDGGEGTGGFTLTATTEADRPFSDVDPTDPYADAITWMANNGIIDGYVMPDGSAVFRPENSVLRAQFAKMIVNILGHECREDMSSPFLDLGVDLLASLYPHEYVAAAYAHGITRGKTTTTFSPYVTISRAQVVTMVVRALRDEWGIASLPDPPDEYENTWGTAFSVAHGKNARIAEYNDLLIDIPLEGAASDPWAPMPRGEVAQVLWNASVGGH